VIFDHKWHSGWHERCSLGVERFLLGTSCGTETFGLRDKDGPRIW
jgi:hypothetical protein